MTGGIGFGHRAIKSGLNLIGFSENMNNVDSEEHEVIQQAPITVPIISSLIPSSVIAGGSGFMLTVQGRNFVSGSTVQLNGSPLATTFVSPAQLNAMVPARLTAQAGAVSVTVVTQGVTSSPVMFTIAALKRSRRLKLAVGWLFFVNIVLTAIFYFPMADEVYPKYGLKGLLIFTSVVIAVAALVLLVLYSAWMFKKWAKYPLRVLGWVLLFEGISEGDTIQFDSEVLLMLYFLFIASFVVTSEIAYNELKKAVGIMGVKTKFIKGGNWRTLELFWYVATAAFFKAPAGAQIKVRYGVKWFGIDSQKQTLDGESIKRLYVSKWWSVFMGRIQILTDTDVSATYDLEPEKVSIMPPNISI